MSTDSGSDPPLSVELDYEEEWVSVQRNSDTDAPLQVDVDAEEVGMAESAAAVQEVYIGVGLTLGLMEDAVESGDPPAELTEERINEFVAAFQAGRKVLEEAGEEFVKHGVSALPEYLRGAVQAHIVPQTPAFGVDVDLEAALESDHA